MEHTPPARQFAPISPPGLWDVLTLSPSGFLSALNFQLTPHPAGDPPELIFHQCCQGSSSLLTVWRYKEKLVKCNSLCWRIGGALGQINGDCCVLNSPVRELCMNKIQTVRNPLIKWPASFCLTSRFPKVNNHGPLSKEPLPYLLRTQLGKAGELMSNVHPRPGDWRSTKNNSQVPLPLTHGG